MATKKQAKITHRTIVYVQVGCLPTKAVEGVLEDFRQKFASQKLPNEQIWFVPIREGDGNTRVETLYLD